jgi:uncharacterized membrane protein YedE/YeeE
MWMAFIGGLLIGLAATLMLAFNGRIMGVSGLLNQSLKAPSQDSLWRWSFLFGLIGGGFLMHALSPSFFADTSARTFIHVLIAGFLVGFGTTMANGCTSGHGICGVARWSPRSVVATGIFILSGMICVGLLRWMGWTF